jgi:MFS family permease
MQRPVAERTAGLLQGIMLLLPITLAVMGIVVLVPVLPQMMAHFAHVPNHQYLLQGGVLTMPALCVMLFSPLAGWLADRFHRRRILIIAMIAYAFLGISPIFIDDLFAIVATRVGVGVCEAVIMTVTTTLICDYFSGPAREKWLASQTAVASLSSLGLVYVGGLLGSAYGWRGPFWTYVFSLVLLIGVVAFTWEPQTPVSAKTDAREEGALSVQFPWAQMLGICAITLFASVMFYAIQTQGSLALEALGVTDPARIGKLTALANLGVPLGTLVFRGLARWPIGLLLSCELVVIGGGFIWMGKAAESQAFVLAAGLNQVGCGMILPTLLTWATRGLAFEVRGRGTGLWTGTFSIGQFLSGMVITFVGEHAGGLSSAFVVVGVTAIAAAALSFVVGIRSSPSRAHQTSEADESLRSRRPV